MQEVLAYARSLARSVSPRSTAVIKAQVWKALRQDFNEALALADGEMQKSFASSDFKEGIAHYVEKREPNWTA
jgi:enoyl-CoA hydratase/carnithine racemase